MLLTILRIAASNALMAVLLAVVVAAVCRIAGRPALARALWVLVLIKLLTPPLWTIPLDGYFGRSASSDAKQRSAPAVVVALPPVEAAAVNQSDTEQALDGSDFGAVADTSAAPVSGEPTRSDMAVDGTTNVDWSLVGEGIVAAWAIGSLACAIAFVRRVRRFFSSLRLTTAATADIQERCAMLAQKLGLRRPPEVRFVRSAFCPSLWAFSRPALVLVPQSLWERLDRDQQDALLIHELAHLRRRDHWVRLLELAATLVYWWHPVVWYARRRLHEAEEQCCDAWVLGTLPASGKSYAAALLEAVDFLSTAHSATPALASGLGDFSSLKRRIVMIQNGSVRKALSWTGAVAVLGLAGVVLPLAPSLGQDSPKEKNAEREQRNFFLAPSDGPAVEENKVAGERERDRAAANMDIEMAIKQAHQEVEQLSAEMAKIHAALEQATARLHKLEAAHAGEGGQPRKLDQKDPKVAEYYYRLKSDSARGDRLERLERQVQQIMVELKQLKTSEQRDPEKRNFDTTRP